MKEVQLQEPLTFRTTSRKRYVLVGGFLNPTMVTSDGPKMLHDFPKEALPAREAAWLRGALSGHKKIGLRTLTHSIGSGESFSAVKFQTTLCFQFLAQWQDRCIRLPRPTASILGPLGVCLG